MSETIQEGKEKGGYKIRSGVRGGMHETVQKGKRKAAIKVDQAPEGGYPGYSRREEGKAPERGMPRTGQKGRRKGGYKGRL